MSRLTDPRPTSRRPSRPKQKADKAGLSEAGHTTRAALSGKDAHALPALQARLLHPDSETAAAYSRHLYPIVRADDTEVTKAADESAAEAQKKFMQLVGAESAHHGATQQAAHWPQAALRAALRNVVEATQAAPGGARLRKGHSPSDKIDQAAQTIEAAFSQLIDERLASRIAPEGFRFVAPNPYVPGYEAAVAAGAQARTEIFKRGDMLSSQDLADKLGVSRETVNQRRRNKELLALQHESRGFRYPAWQIEPAARDAIAGVLVELGESADCWSAYLFFTQPNPLLSGATPLQALTARKSAQVLRAAAAMRDELA